MTFVWFLFSLIIVVANCLWLLAKEAAHEAVDKLNSRPIKCLGYRTPYEVFKELTGVDAREVMGYAFITWIQDVISGEVDKDGIAWFDARTDLD